MLFNSFSFLLFFPIVTIGYFLLAHRYRWIWLLLASCFFYMSFIPVYISILFLTIVIDYGAGILIEQSGGRKKQFYLIFSIVATCLILFVFKYFNFFNSNMADLARFLDWNYYIGMLNIILPIGLSFHTFQSLSYVIEVYLGRQKAERHLGIYSLYVMFYPQLVAGPIERPQNLLHQFREEHQFDYKRVTDGLKLMAWGLFKKVVIADRLALLVNHVYGNPQQFSGLQLIIATVFFAYQLYCDFSGYSDIAIGASQVMGFQLMENFKRPYFSKSVSEFWQRWHISLSTWLKDYLFTPISMSKRHWGRYGNLYALMVTFFIIGLWHGANWTFVVFGLLHGGMLCYELLTAKRRKKWLKTYRIYPFVAAFLTFSFVCFSFIFFRAKNLGDAGYIVTHLFSGLSHVSTYPDQIFNLIKFEIYGKVGYSKGAFLVSLLSICGLELIHLIQRRYRLREELSKKSTLYRWLLYYAIGLAIIFLGVFEKSAFIYFQF